MIERLRSHGRRSVVTVICCCAIGIIVWRDVSMDSRKIGERAIRTCNVVVVMVMMRMGAPMVENKPKVVDTFCSSLDLCMATLTITFTAASTIIITEAGVSSADLEG